ncbi:UDP-N-acetylmuramate--L-alanine ligase [Flavobacterium sp. xlx-214]|uniref:UDP-N-acetylmuramate--L-alanine ligase n=1 Tax=unclassified Flavobacterium TaxID=196869 RepID=UPI0013D7261A|nr:MULTISPECIES: UDP-N-acetylmuramate--L-alanine ligase [unclassified Flavobacterium]MBA5791932.1 UDP-N-acetylmuramate--L-alanine ligase [Flavobacterium sp. xlx-221]QMI84188.1 UDP-N-acetylmuramate--L-alanine ligase [Flavobacterium sp. xlx-214]
MNIKEIHNVFFVGIGGIGMSAIARYFKRMGKNVAGYDKTPTHLTHELETEGIVIHYTDDVAHITEEYRDNKNTLVVYTPAVPKHHTELNYFQNNGFAVKKRAEVLGIITQNSFSLAVAGTHGKTTTSSMLAHILVHANAPVTAFLGGVVEGYDSNLIGSGTEATVVEADEFDRSFLHLHPNIACIISDDADHLDIYGTNDAIKSSFAEFAAKIDNSEHLFIAQGIKNINGTEVSVNGSAVINAYNLRFENGKRVFDLDFKGEIISNIKLLMPGEHNVLNASLAFSMAKTYGLSNDEIKAGLDSFKGIRRRFSFKINTEKLVMIDDYAHHPTEINAVSQAVHEMYPNRNITAVFQPHLFSRTRDFMDGFAESLSTFNDVILLDIYPARELPMDGINSEVLINKIKSAHKILLPKEEVVSFLSKKSLDVLLIIGAGDIGEMVDEIKEILEKNN